MDLGYSCVVAQSLLRCCGNRYYVVSSGLMDSETAYVGNGPWLVNKPLTESKSMHRKIVQLYDTGQYEKLEKLLPVELVYQGGSK